MRPKEQGYGGHKKNGQEKNGQSRPTAGYAPLMRSAGSWPQSTSGPEIEPSAAGQLGPAPAQADKNLRLGNHGPSQVSHDH
jgi:hypothetical protein